MAEPDTDDDVIDEDPMTKREFEYALGTHLPRSDRRRFWRALVEADLIVFRG